ncbi:hypothetical protein NP233_g2759 [Leucocoprinus birnbaumii]|uniref:Uncharacterized protein n=1 Tax=Leucocoprinus birnbaumii TaxID=56174 RepID=A0AAD5YUJ9_9AGAR|nr:hypothetical protein NP233_g2759 [Leucocoprinus birnbaumii]
MMTVYNRIFMIFALVVIAILPLSQAGSLTEVALKSPSESNIEILECPATPTPGLSSAVAASTSGVSVSPQTASGDGVTNVVEDCCVGVKSVPWSQNLDISLLIARLYSVTQNGAVLASCIVENSTILDSGNFDLRIDTWVTPEGQERQYVWNTLRFSNSTNPSCPGVIARAVAGFPDPRTYYFADMYAGVSDRATDRYMVYSCGITEGKKEELVQIPLMPKRFLNSTFC